MTPNTVFHFKERFVLAITAVLCVKAYKIYLELVEYFSKNKIDLTSLIIFLFMVIVPPLAVASRGSGGFWGLSTTILIILCILLGVGFFTLLERKVLSYIQYRKGPNKVGLLGIPQPLADAAKLFTKQYIKVFFSNNLFFSYRPIFAMIIILVLWSLYNSIYGFNLK